MSTKVHAINSMNLTAEIEILASYGLLYFKTLYICEETALKGYLICKW